MYTLADRPRPAAAAAWARRCLAGRGRRIRATGLDATPTCGDIFTGETITRSSWTDSGSLLEVYASGATATLTDITSAAAAAQPAARAASEWAVTFPNCSAVLITPAPRGAATVMYRDPGAVAFTRAAVVRPRAAAKTCCFTPSKALKT